MIADIPTLDQVLDLALKLPRRARAELVARLALELGEVEPSPVRTMSPADALSTLAEIREAFRAQGPTNPSMAEDLEASRR